MNRERTYGAGTYCGLPVPDWREPNLASPREKALLGLYTQRIGPSF